MSLNYEEKKHLIFLPCFHEQKLLPVKRRVLTSQQVSHLHCDLGLSPWITEPRPCYKLKEEYDFLLFKNKWKISYFLFRAREKRSLTGRLKAAVRFKNLLCCLFFYNSPNEYYEFIIYAGVYVPTHSITMAYLNFIVY